jgi:hypothetical protein
MRYSTTYYSMSAARNDLLPPVITQALPNVAEPPPADLAIEYHVSYPSAPNFQASLQDNDGSGAPAAWRIRSDGTSAPLSGTQPVFNYSICGGNEALQQMRVVQSVMNGIAADGRALPAGVYFVRTRDAAGRAASARISLVR